MFLKFQGGLGVRRNVFLAFQVGVEGKFEFPQIPGRSGVGKNVSPRVKREANTDFPQRSLPYKGSLTFGCSFD